MPGNALFAQANNASFFGALSNFGKLEDYKLIQSFYGKLNFEEFGDHISAEYRLTINSIVDEDRDSSFNRVSAFVKFYNHKEVNDSTPFKEMTIQANGEMIADSQEDLYFKLVNFNIGLVEPEPFAVLDVEQMMASSDLYKGTWYHMSASDLGDTNGEEIEVEEYLEFENQFKKEPKKAILGITEQALIDSDESFMEDEIEEIMQAVALGLETKLFMERDVVAGRNEGFKFFNMNKSAIINFFVELGELLDEELTANDISEIRSALSHVSVSGIYRIENVHGIIDNLLVRFKLSDVEPVNNLELNYRYKLSDMNKDNKVTPPANYEEWYIGDLWGDEWDEEWDDEWYLEDEDWGDEWPELEEEF